jgi:hypothetical protein
MRKNVLTSHFPCGNIMERPTGELRRGIEKKVSFFCIPHKAGADGEQK